MIVSVSKLNEKGQITIPKEIRERLNLIQGDKLAFKIKENQIIITKLQTNKISEILNKQKPWSEPSVQFQREFREEWG